MSSSRSKSRSQSPNDNSVGKTQVSLKIHLQGAIPKRNLQPDNEEFGLEEVSGSPQKDKERKQYKESQSHTSRPNEEVIKHKDGQNSDGASENVKRGKKDQKVRSPTENRHRGTTSDELGTSRSDRDRETKPTPQKVRPHTDRKHYVDKRDDAAVGSRDYEGDSKNTRHKSRHGDRKYHAKEKPKNYEDTDSDVPKKTTQQKQSEKYEGLPLEENSEGRSRSNKSSNKERENAEQKQKLAGGTASPGSSPESGTRDDISLIFPDCDGNKSTMRIVVRSFATPTKSQNYVDVKIEGEKFGKINNKEIENLIRELTKYVIQIQRALEDNKIAPGNKSINEQHNSLEVIELFKRTDKHSGKSVKEIKITPTKSKLELGISMKFIPVGSEKLEHEKLSPQETNKKSEQTKARSASESRDNKHPERQTNTNEEVTSKHRKSKKELTQEECKSNKRDDGQDGKEEPRELKYVAAQTTFDSEENYQKEESNMGGTQEESGKRKTGKKRTIDNVDSVTKNPKKPKAEDSDSMSNDSKKRNQTKKKSKSKVQSSQGVTSVPDAKKDMDGKVSLTCMKSSVNKMLLKLTCSRTLVAEGLTAAIRNKHKDEKPEKEKTKKNSRSKIEERLSMTKTVKIPVVYEEKEPAFQSKSSIKINMEHSTGDGNLSLNLVGIRNEEKQDFGGRIEFCHAYNDPKKTTEDVETMKELLTKCVKKVENVLSTLYKEQNKTALQNESSPKIKNPTELAVEAPNSDPQAVEAPNLHLEAVEDTNLQPEAVDVHPQAVEIRNSHQELDGIIRKQSSITMNTSPFEYSHTKPSASGTSIKASDRKISFRDANLIEVVPGDDSSLLLESDAIDEECGGRSEGECSEDNPDIEDPEMANKDVNDIVEAKLDAGEFEQEAKKMFERERFSLSLKDPDAIERYKRISRCKLVQGDPENGVQNSSTTNLALTLSADDQNTTAYLGINMWPSEVTDSNSQVQINPSQPTSDDSEKVLNDSNSTMAKVASTSSQPPSFDLENKEKRTSIGSAHDSSKLVALMASMYTPLISSDFENVGRKPIKNSTNDIITTPMAMASRTSNRNSSSDSIRKKSILKTSNTQITKVASTTSRTISVDFENKETIIPRGSIDESDTPLAMPKSSTRRPTSIHGDMKSLSCLYDNTSMAMKESPSSHLTPDPGKFFETTDQIVMTARVPNRPTTNTVSEGEEAHRKKKECCEHTSPRDPSRPTTSAVPEGEEAQPRKKGCCVLI